MDSKVLILLVEDDLVDVMTIKRAFKDLKIINPLAVVGNGLEALAFLKNKANKKPGLILLDINMPKMNGIEFLQIVKNDKKLKSIPVVVLTTSKNEPNKIETINLGISGYFVKPIDYLEFVELVKTIYSYWTLSEQIKYTHK